MSEDTTLPRLTTVFDHPNKFASYLFVILGIYLISYLSIKNNKKSKYPLLKLLPFLVLGLFLLLTFSRTSWIVFAFIICVVIFLKKEFRLPTIYLGSLLIFLSLFVQKIRERILGIFVRQYHDTLSGRMETWDMAWFGFKKNYWFGYGPGSFREVIKVVSGTDVGNFYPHSDAALFLLEGGIIGLISYLIYLFFALYSAFISYYKYPKGSEKILFAKKELTVDFKFLGFIPFLLFLVMLPYSFAETPALDFIYQVYAWILLGSWLGLVNNKKNNC
jgi:O-antigen ligase